MKLYLAPVSLAVVAGLVLTGAASAAPDKTTVFMFDDITAVFEQGANAPQYGNIENDKDGCGWTAGWIGFCTATGDMLQLVEKYNKAKPGNVLEKYTPTLRKLADSGSDSVKELGSKFPADWKTAAKDKAFQQLQITVGHDMYLTPALTTASKIGLKTNLGIENLFDTALMMGPGAGDCDGMPKIVKETTAAAGGTPASGKNEKAWLKTYNEIRVKHMKKPCTPGREADWPQAVDRAAALQKLSDTGKQDLRAPLTIGAGYDVTITNPHD
ncbi:chitosanase [Amycolatopsis sp. cg5]|uniref:chitosanase n=1 Tax=Amycolatopsis sp. cg5 TaxID=3238802 RepID=UPI0035258CAD